MMKLLKEIQLEKVLLNFYKRRFFTMKKIMKQFGEGIISFLACMFFLGGIATVFGICIITVVKLLSLFCGIIF